MGEIMFRGNITMKGYLKNRKATEDAFAGGWFRSGDLAVMQPDGYIKIKDRAKDIIISAARTFRRWRSRTCSNRHPAVLAAAVVAKPDPKWGERMRVRRAESGRGGHRKEIIDHCRASLAGFKTPRTLCSSAAEDIHGKNQKFLLRQQAKSTEAIE